MLSLIMAQESKQAAPPPSIGTRKCGHNRQVLMIGPSQMAARIPLRRMARDILSDDPYAGLREIIRSEQRRGRGGHGRNIRIVR